MIYLVNNKKVNSSIYQVNPNLVSESLYLKIKECDTSPILLIIPSTPFFREVASILASKSDIPLISDCTELWKDEEMIYARKPSVDGKNFARYELSFDRSYIILMKGMDGAELLKTYEYLELSLGDFRDSDDQYKVLEIRESKFKGKDIKEAELIFSGGRGIMNEESFQALRKLADRYGAAVGASRPMVDQGWATWEEQVGQTGSFVHPKVYVAFGISGAVQHITGIEKSQNIIAINLNKSSPIFRYSGHGAYADDNSIIRNMLNLIDKE